MVREYPLRQGKYLRPALVLLAASAMGFKPKLALPTAAAMQLSEDWLLIIDDFQDSSEFRRQKPALHRLYGAPLAVNAASALHLIMEKTLIENERLLDKIKSKKIREEFFRFLSRAAEGQATELMFGQNSQMFTDKDWYFIADGKTSYYTIAGPMRLGAIIAGADEKQLESLAEFGSALGRAFQLVDDLLDLTVSYKGKEQKLGGDIKEGKRTLVLGHLERLLGPADLKRLKQIMARGTDKSWAEIDWVITKMHEHGSLDYARNLAQRHKEKAANIFEKELSFLSREPARSKLKTLINFIVERDH